MYDYDVCVVGGGPSGVITAYSVAKAGYKCIILDKKPRDLIGDKNCGDALDGLYTLLLTVVREDGTFEEASVPVTVDNIGPTAEILFPLENQIIFEDDEWVIVQARVEDDISDKSLEESHA